MPPICAVVIVFLTTAHTIKRKEKASLKNVLDEAVKVNFIKALCLSTCLFNILYEEMGNMPRAPCCILQNRVVLRKSTCAIEWRADLVAFCVKYHFLLKELTGQLKLPDLSIWQYFIENE